MRCPGGGGAGLRTGGMAGDARPGTAMPADPPPSRLARLRGLYRGRRGVILCNGPSLNRMDLSFLRRELVIGLNKIHLGLPRFGFWPACLVVVNPRVAEQAAPAIRSLVCLKVVGSRAAAHLPEDAFTHHVPVLAPPVAFSEDLSRGLREGGTVTHAALQVAYWLGFAELVIIGMDHRYVYDGPPNAARRLVGPDPNHFDPGYFAGQIWDSPDLALSEASYAAARAVFEAAGRRIVDATVDGACRVFEKADYRVVFGL
jgi:hypothetical protein